MLFIQATFNNIVPGTLPSGVRSSSGFRRRGTSRGGGRPAGPGAAGRGAPHRALPSRHLLRGPRQ